MPCTIPQTDIEAAIAFHGHFCPGLMIGLRAAELALGALDHPPAPEMVAITETDMCGVDAIQVLTGCTYGKGNLIHRDLGKMAFSFFDRRSGRGFRCVVRPDALRGASDGYGELAEKVAGGGASAADEARLQAMRDERRQFLHDIALEDLFTLAWLSDGPPRPARILESLACARCGESTMESRTRRLGGETLCIPCFEAVEQKL